jgi:hypothetical protein
LHPHADNGDLILNIYMTPEQYNRRPDTGGFILLDVSRGDDTPFHEFASPPWCIEYLAARTRGRETKIAYRYNRAILFNGRLFHKTDVIDFTPDIAGGARLSLTYVFGDKEASRRRFEASKVSAPLG